MKNMKKVIALFLSLFIILGQVNVVSAQETAQTYYVDNTSGDDSNDGLSESSAWKTLDKIGSEVFEAGDQILLKRGEEWEGSISLNGSGESGKRIVLSAYGQGAKPKINGNGVEDVIQILNEEHWEISYLELTNNTPGVNPTAARRGIHVINENYGGESLTETNLDTTTSLNDFYIHNMYIHDVIGQDAKDANGSAGIQFTVRIPNMINDQIPTDDSINQRTTFDGITVEDNILENIQRSGIILWSDWKSRDLLRHQDFAYGDKAKTPWTPILNVHIKGNKLYDIGGDGIAPHMTDGAVVEYNYINGYNTKSTGYNAGMWLWNGDNSLFQYNEATGGKSTRDGMPWDFDQGTQGTVYQYNYSYDNEGGALLFCSEDAGEGVKDGIFRYNLSYNDRYQTFTICGGSALKDVNVYNNVFYLDETMTTKPSVTQGGGVEVNLYNNIFVNNGKGGYAGKASFDYSHNIYAGTNTNGLNSVKDPFKITEDPKFIDAKFPGTVLDKDMDTRDIYDWSALEGFMVSEDSKAVNGGRFITVEQDRHPGATDMFKNNLYNGAPDIGMHEYSAKQFDPVDPFIPELPKPVVEIINGDFENTAQHANGAPWNYQWNATISKENPFKGDFSGAIKVAGSGGSIEQTLRVNPETQYKVTAKTVNGVEGEELYLGVKWAGKELKVPVTHTEYSDSEIVFDIPKGVTSANVFFYRANGSSKMSFIDNVRIEEIKPVDKSELDTVIKTAETFDLTGYTTESIKAFNDILAEARILFQDETATQEEVNAMLTKVNETKDVLIKIVDKSDLEDKVSEIEAIDRSLFTPSSLKTLDELVAEIKLVLEDVNASQEEVNEALAKLENYGSLLVEKTDTLELLKSVNEAKSIDRSLYTVESLEEYDKVIAKAEAALLNEDITQAEVEALIQDVKEAKDILVKLDSGTVDPVKPEEKEDNKKPEVKPETVPTGLMNISLVLLFILISSLAVTATLLITSRKNDMK